MIDLEHITAEHFSPLIGTQLALEGSDQTLTVDAVEALTGESPRGRGFSVLFSTPIGLKGDQGIYHLLLPEGGVLALLLVPIGTQQGRCQLEAVFN
jgi:hypothetical protein